MRALDSDPLSRALVLLGTFGFSYAGASWLIDCAPLLGMLLVMYALAYTMAYAILRFAGILPHFSPWHRPW